MAYKGRLFNREQVYVCGDYIEGDIYPVFQPAGKRRKRCRPTSAIQERLNQLNREKQLTRVIRANASAGDYVLHPTWAGAVSQDRAKKDIRNFILWMKRQYRKAGAEFWHILTMEYGEKSGKLHAHMIVPKGIDRDVIEDYWRERHGFCNCDRLQFDESGGEKLATYLSKPRKVSKDGTERFFKSWSGSRNLIRPEPAQIDGQIGMDELEALGEAVDAGAAHAEFERRFPGYELLRAVTYRNEINRGVYVHFELRRRRGSDSEV